MLCRGATGRRWSVSAAVSRGRAGPLSCHDHRRSEASLLFVRWRIPPIFVSMGRSGRGSIRGPADPLHGTLHAVMNCFRCVQISRSIGSSLLPRISNLHGEIPRFPQSSLLKRDRHPNSSDAARHNTRVHRTATERHLRASSAYHSPLGTAATMLS